MSLANLDGEITPADLLDLGLVARDSNGRMQPVTAVPVGAPTGVAATDWANISAAVTKAQAIVATGGIAEVVFRGCPYLAGTLTPYAIGGNSIPIYSGVHYVGRPPIAVPADATGTLPDGHWKYIGGTVISGDGTAPAFWDLTVDRGSPQAHILDNTITRVRIYGFGIQNVTYGILSGAQNTQGIVYGEIDEIFVADATQWGVSFTNFQHMTFGKIFTNTIVTSAGGQYYGANWTASSPGDGNSVWYDLFHQTSNLPLNRGIVFEAKGTNNHLGSVHVVNLQHNAYNRSLQSDTATFTNASANVAVADGTKYAVGLPVWFTATNFGFTVDQAYIVLSVVGNTITLGTKKSASAVVASGAGTLTCNSYGMPLLEVCGVASGDTIPGAHFEWLDLEGSATTAVYLEAVQGGRFHLIANATSQAMVTMRGSSFCRIHSDFAAWIDIDNNVGSSFEGELSGFRQKPTAGLWHNGTTGIYELGLGSSTLSPADLRWGSGGFLYPSGSGMGSKISAAGSTANESLRNVGIILCQTSAITRTLPTITDIATPSTSCVGAVFEYVNLSGGNITIASNGTQTFNLVGGLVSLTLANQKILRVIAAQNGGSFYWVAYEVAVRIT